MKFKGKKFGCGPIGGTVGTSFSTSVTGLSLNNRTVKRLTDSTEATVTKQQFENLAIVDTYLAGLTPEQYDSVMATLSGYNDSGSDIKCR